MCITILCYHGFLVAEQFFICGKLFVREVFFKNLSLSAVVELKTEQELQFLCKIG